MLKGFFFFLVRYFHLVSIFCYFCRLFSVALFLLYFIVDHTYGFVFVSLMRLFIYVILH
jgi:hypothetical protein